MASDPLVAKRTWDDVMEAMIKLKQGPTRERYERARKEKPMERIRQVRLIETQAEHFLATLEAGTVSTNVHLRKLHNFALGMNWLPTPVIPRRQWPEVFFKEKRAITREEHERITTNSSIGRMAKTTPGMFLPMNFPRWKPPWPATPSISN
jgi:hypothetical protein